jgi:hypothetical protein
LLCNFPQYLVNTLRSKCFSQYSLLRGSIVDNVQGARSSALHNTAHGVFGQHNNRVFTLVD